MIELPPLPQGRVLPVVVAPDPVLSTRCVEVDPLDDAVVQLAADLLATQRVSPGCVGLAANLVSLGHVALPFPPDDPVYGFVPGSGRDGIPSIGSWLLRGENGAITLSLGSLTRLRSNPFWPLIDADVAALVAQDLAAPRR